MRTKSSEKIKCYFCKFIDEGYTSSNIENDKYTYGKGYRLEVPEGYYYVFAIGGDQYKAYYSEFVTCGLSVNCQSHQPIIVKVFNGKTTNNIDPQDWYKPLE